jgi:hypothetical protein
MTPSWMLCSVSCGQVPVGSRKSGLGHAAAVAEVDRLLDRNTGAEVVTMVATLRVRFDQPRDPRLFACDTSTGLADSPCLCERLAASL